MAGKMRSPNYPSLTLAQAIDGARKLWESDKKTAVNHESAAQAMGYKALSGAARAAIGALRQYGLIDKTDKGHVRISDLAIRLLHGTESERASAMAEAAMSPVLFAELARTHLGASENAIRSHLITKKDFAEDGALRAARAFREIAHLAGDGQPGYNHNSGDGTPEDMSTFDSGQNQHGGSGSGSGGSQDGTTLPPMSWVLSVPRGIRADVRITGKDVRREDLLRLKKQIDFLVESFEEPSTASGD